METSFKEVQKKFAIYQEFSSSDKALYFVENGKNFKLLNEQATSKKEELLSDGFHILDVNDDYLIIERGLDLQTHLRFPGQDHKETLMGGLEAAFFGGYDSLVAMPNTTPFFR